MMKKLEVEVPTDAAAGASLRDQRRGHRFRSVPSSFRYGLALPPGIAADVENRHESAPCQA